jgi:ABC-2 type transport system permease protein
MAIIEAKGLARDFTSRNGIARISPFRYIIDAMREAYAGQYWNAVMVEGICVALGTAAILLWLGSRVFVHENS